MYLFKVYNIMICCMCILRNDDCNTFSSHPSPRIVTIFFLITRTLKIYSLSKISNRQYSLVNSNHRLSSSEHTSNWKCVLFCPPLTSGNHQSLLSIYKFRFFRFHISVRLCSICLSQILLYSIVEICENIKT